MATIKDRLKEEIKSYNQAKEAFLLSADGKKLTARLSKEREKQNSLCCFCMRRKWCINKNWHEITVTEIAADDAKSVAKPLPSCFAYCDNNGTFKIASGFSHTNRNCFRNFSDKILK